MNRVTPCRCWEFASLDLTRPPTAIESIADSDLEGFRSYLTACCSGHFNHRAAPTILPRQRNRRTA